MSFVEHSVFFTLVLIVATLGTAVSGIGVLKMLDVAVPQLPLFADDSTMLHFVAYANIIFYAILFLWAANAGLTDAAIRMRAFVERKKPLNRAAAAEAEGDYKKAAHFYLSYLGDHRQDTDAMRLYGLCLVKLGRFDDAIEVFRRIMAAARGVKSLSAGVEIAHIFEARLGDPKAAAKEIKSFATPTQGRPLRGSSKRGSGLAARETPPADTAREARAAATEALLVTTLAHVLGLPAVALLVWGILTITLEWKYAFYWWFRPGVMLYGAGCAGGLYLLSGKEMHFVIGVYVVLITALLIIHAILALVALGRIDPLAIELKREKGKHPALRRAAAHERSYDFHGAVAAYDEYLAENPGDSAARGRLAEALIKAGNAKRAISVLTIAFTQAEDDKQKIAFGVRLAEVILVTQHDPLAARAQLEQVKILYAGTEHEGYIADLSERMMKRVADGKYLKAKPQRPGY